MNQILRVCLLAAILYLDGQSIATARGPHRFRGGRGATGNAPAARQPDTPETTAITQEDQQSLQHMRQEEKMARDVYRALHKTWNIPIFDHIAGAEQRHFDAVGNLLTHYQVENPSGALPPGRFEDPDMQKLHDQLLKQGQGSLAAALKAGAAIEDLDIKDLQEYIDRTQNSQIKRVYGNLLRGSRNHMRAFNYQLTSRGETYQARHLTQKEIDHIVASPHERGGNHGVGQGCGGGTCGGQGGPKGPGCGKGGSPGGCCAQPPAQATPAQP